MVLNMGVFWDLAGIQTTFGAEHPDINKQFVFESTGRHCREPPANICIGGLFWLVWLSMNGFRWFRLVLSIYQGRLPKGHL